jgi:hypothetical protein
LTVNFAVFLGKKAETSMRGLQSSQFGTAQQPFAKRKLLSDLDSGTSKRRRKDLEPVEISLNNSKKRKKDDSLLDINDSAEESQFEPKKKGKRSSSQSWTTDDEDSPTGAKKMKKQSGKDSSNILSYVIYVWF